MSAADVQTMLAQLLKLVNAQKQTTAPTVPSLGLDLEALAAEAEADNSSLLTRYTEVVEAKKWPEIVNEDLSRSNLKAGAPFIEWAQRPWIQMVQHLLPSLNVDNCVTSYGTQRMLDSNAVLNPPHSEAVERMHDAWLAIQSTLEPLMIADALILTDYKRARATGASKETRMKLLILAELNGFIRSRIGHAFANLQLADSDHAARTDCKVAISSGGPTTSAFSLESLTSRSLTSTARRLARKKHVAKMQKKAKSSGNKRKSNWSNGRGGFKRRRNNSYGRRNDDPFTMKSLAKEPKKET